MAAEEVMKAKVYRLEQLRKYQAYYGPNTPYPVVVEINKLETELQQTVQAGATRRTPVVKRKKKEPKPPVWQFWRMSQATIDLIATIAFIGLVFLLGSIVFAAYMQSTSPTNAASVSAGMAGSLPPTRRPTFTPTAGPDGAVPPAAAEAELSEGASYLPTPGQVPTEVSTPVPTMTPSHTPEPTATPAPTETPLPTTTPLPPPQPAAAAAPASAASAPASEEPAPEPPPDPGFPFAVSEQGNRAFQKTNYHVITIYVAVVSEGNIPLGGYKVVGDHVPSGAHVESGLSTWNWDVVNCLDCDYVKQGNLKFEPGPFTDGVWNIYLADPGGSQLSPAVPLSYSSNPEEWVWDFVIFRRKNG
jgi:hypothetical protein